MIIAIQCSYNQSRYSRPRDSGPAEVKHGGSLLCLGLKIFEF